MLKTAEEAVKKQNPKVVMVINSSTTSRKKKMNKKKTTSTKGGVSKRRLPLKARVSTAVRPDTGNAIARLTWSLLRRRSMGMLRIQVFMSLKLILILLGVTIYGYWIPDVVVI